jgi:hypothetical protein
LIWKATRETERKGGFEMQIYAMTPTKRDEPSKTKSLADQLLDQAEAEERLAEQFKGCMFHGEWPGSAHLRQAALLRQAAIALKIAEPKPKSPAEVAAEAASRNPAQ